MSSRNKGFGCFEERREMNCQVRAACVLMAIDGRDIPPCSLGRYSVALLIGSKLEWFQRNLKII